MSIDASSFDTWWLLATQQGLILIITVVMGFSTWKFWQEKREGHNGLTNALMLERFALTIMFLSNFLTGLGVWWSGDFLGQYIVPLLWISTVTKLALIAAFIYFWIVVNRAEHN